MNNDKELMDKFINAVYNSIKRGTQKEINDTNIEFNAVGVVTETTDIKDENGNVLSTESAVVDIGFVVTDSIRNLSGEKLIAGDAVKIFYDKRDMRNAYIGIKF